MRKDWYSFSEVKQTWLGFSLSGNSGCGMVNDFASGVYDGLNSIFLRFWLGNDNQRPVFGKVMSYKPSSWSRQDY